MKSGAINHFPPVRLLPENKQLWNRLERRTLKIRPEERVRLCYIDYLTLECGVPNSRIATEQTLPQTKYSSALRADIICFDNRFNPEILIECKAESVNLNLQAAEQIARYNRDIHAPYLCITNGLEDFWFRTGREGCEALDTPPVQSVRNIRQIRLEPEYWEERGGTAAPLPDTDPFWITETLEQFWSDRQSWDATWVDAGKSTAELHLDHTYRIVEQDDIQIAVTLMAGFDKQTWVTALYNRDGETFAVAGCSLNRLLEGSVNSWRIDADGRHEFELSGREAHLPGVDPARWVESLPALLSRLLEDA